MNTVLTLTVALLASASTVLMGLAGEQGPAGEGPSANSPSVREKELVFENNENGAALVALAVERFNQDRKNGLRQVLTLTRDIEIAKYGDGQFTVVALPVDRCTNYCGIERFVHAYNHMVIREADSRLNRGELDTAEHTFKLLLKHNPSNAYTNELRKRVLLISEAKADRDLVNLVTQVRKLEPTEDLFSLYGDLGTKPVQVVSNLLSLEIKDGIMPTTSENVNPRPSPNRNSK
jgi:hypothetical protein